MQVQSLGWEDLLEKEMATHSSILAWKIPWTKEPGELESMGLQRVLHDWATSLESKPNLCSQSFRRKHLVSYIVTEISAENIEKHWQSSKLN